MRLGELIDTLAGLDPDLLVRYDNGHLPQTFFSWRGIYAELTLHESFRDWDPEGKCFTEDPPRTVRDLLAEARAANGGTFKGYKGGDYTMGLDTPVWADAYGCYSCNAITGIKVDGDQAILTTLNISDYR